MTTRDSNANRAAVIGGGIMGLGIGWQLVERGWSVTVLERGRAGAEASSAAAGMLAPLSEVEYDEPDLLALALESQAGWPGFVDELQAASGVDIGYDTTGILTVAYDRDDVEAIERIYEYQREIGLDARWLDAEACREREPYLSPRVLGGVDCRGDHAVDTSAVVEALRGAFVSAGGILREGTTVGRVIVEDEAVRGVELADGELVESDAVLVAAGAWSGAIGGLQDHAPPVRPIKGEILTLRMDPERPLLRHVVRGCRVYLVPRLSGALVVGATVEDRGFDRRVTAGAVYELLEAAYELLPGVYELELEKMSVGFRPTSRDNGPIVGGCEVGGLFFATGHHRNGIQQAPLTIYGVSAAIDGEPLPEVMRPFTIARFAS